MQKRFKYRIERGAEGFIESWVCEPCKKKNAESILLGKWKLIDRCEDPLLPCAYCSAAGETGVTVEKQAGG